MEKFSETNIEIRNQRIDYTNRRWEQLYELEKEWGEKALKYLFLTNSGGAIATLSFLGASKFALETTGVKIALFLFIFGILLVGISTAKQFHHMSKLFTSWKLDVNKYYEDKISYHELNEADEKIAEEDRWDIAIPYSSLFCFIGGCIAGATALF